MKVGIPKESLAGELRVAIVPTLLSTLKKANLDVLVEAGAGESAGFPDKHYTDAGARVVSRDEVWGADIILQVRSPGANLDGAGEMIGRMQENQVVIGFGDPLSGPGVLNDMAARKVSHFAMELMPRITRAQTMDALSSMATVAGYKAVLLAAEQLPRMFPLLMTAAGTVKPARVFIIGAGVMGLQAIATARRLGAIVEAYDIRPAAKEQVLSLGAKFAELPLEAGEAEDKGGYAREMGEEFINRQREAMARWVADSDVVITTAAIPGKKAPVLVTGEMIRQMRPGSVVVDMAAEQGGNVDISRAGETFVEDGVTVLGPRNLAATIPFHASQMYGRNITSFLTHLLTKEGDLKIDREDEITAATLVTHDGEIVHSRVREVMGLPELPSPEAKHPEGAGELPSESASALAEESANGEQKKADEKPEGEKPAEEASGAEESGEERAVATQAEEERSVAVPQEEERAVEATPKSEEEQKVEGEAQSEGEKDTPEGGEDKPEGEGEGESEKQG